MTQFHRHEPPDLPPVERRCPACQGWGRLGSDIWCDRCDGTGEIAPPPPDEGGWRGLWLARDLRATDTGCVTTELAPGIAKGWLARLAPKQPGDQYDLRREFAVASGSQRAHSGGALREYELAALADGIYEAETVGERQAQRRVYFLVRAQRVTLVYQGKHDAIVALERDWR